MNLVKLKLKFEICSWVKINNTKRTKFHDNNI